MSTPVSVIIVSRGRPDKLRLCLTGVSQLLYPTFEVIVVADPDGVEVADAWFDQIKVVPFDDANISAARNAGIAQAAGDIIAFIDDDAVPEPTWLAYLVSPFADQRVNAAGGFVRGRNGISFQWKARDVRQDALSYPLDLDEERPTVLTPYPGLGVKTEGTNMAFRRDTLARIGGFDPAFRFYLDDTDLNMRLASFGGQTAIVPLAQVHHGYAASDRRQIDRVPLDLTQIAASLIVYLRKHLPGGDHEALLQAERERQRQRVLTHMVAGRLGPGDVRRLLAGFDRGRRDGLSRPTDPLPPLSDISRPFRRFVPDRPDQGDLVQSGRQRKSQDAMAAAAQAASEGYRVSVFILSKTARYHRVSFQPDGYWLHQGGLFGRSDRTDPLFRFWRFKSRVARETALVAKVRRIS